MTVREADVGTPVHPFCVAVFGTGVTKGIPDRGISVPLTVGVADVLLVVVLVTLPAVATVTVNGYSAMSL